MFLFVNLFFLARLCQSVIVTEPCCTAFLDVPSSSSKVNVAVDGSLSMFSLTDQGCAPYPTNFFQGAIAMVREGPSATTCSDNLKAFYAQQAGAVGLIIFNDQTNTPKNAPVNSNAIPVVEVGNSVGQSLLAYQNSVGVPLTLHLTTKSDCSTNTILCPANTCTNNSQCLTNGGCACGSGFLQADCSGQVADNNVLTDFLCVPDLSLQAAATTAPTVPTNAPTNPTQPGFQFTGVVVGVSVAGVILGGVGVMAVAFNVRNAKRVNSRREGGDNDRKEKPSNRGGGGGGDGGGYNRGNYQNIKNRITQRFQDVTLKFNVAIPRQQQQQQQLLPRDQQQGLPPMTNRPYETFQNVRTRITTTFFSSSPVVAAGNMRDRFTQRFNTSPFSSSNAGGNRPYAPQVPPPREYQPQYPSRYQNPTPFSSSGSGSRQDPYGAYDRAPPAAAAAAGGMYRPSNGYRGPPPPSSSQQTGIYMDNPSFQPRYNNYS